MSIDEKEVEELKKTTRFTEKEIRLLYKYAGGSKVTRDRFDAVMKEHGLKAHNLNQRLWDLFDVDDDSEVSVSELIATLSKLLRGTLEEVAALFFELYDSNHDGSVDAKEIATVYSSLLDNTTNTRLTERQRGALTEWLKSADTNKDGEVSKDEFVAAVVKNAKDEENRRAHDAKVNGCGAKFCKYFTVTWLIVATAVFELGTSFSLPAMGALSSRVKTRFGISDAEIGTATGVYFAAAMIGPLIGGFAMDKVGPAMVVTAANVLVTLGALLQTVARGPSQFWLLIIGRLLLGAGGETTPFCTIECLARLFPKHLMVMASWRNFFQSASGFLAFVTLPWVANTFGPEGGPNEDRGTDFALGLCAVLGGVSTLANIFVWIHMHRARARLAVQPDTPARQIRAAAGAIAPRPSAVWRRYLFPFSFFVAVYCIKCVYFAPISFTAVSVDLLAKRYNQAPSAASFQSGFISLLAGILSPPIGPITDRTGQRALWLSGTMFFSCGGFILLAIVTVDGAAVPWIATIAMGISYAVGDTLGYMCIRFIVGEERAGAGYGAYAVLGNAISFGAPTGAGAIYAIDNGGPNGQLYSLIYFAALTGVGALGWLFIHFKEGSKSVIALKANAVVRTTDAELDAAALFTLLGSGEKAASDEEEGDESVPLEEVKSGGELKRDSILGVADGTQTEKGTGDAMSKSAKKRRSRKKSSDSKKEKEKVLKNIGKEGGESPAAGVGAEGGDGGDGDADADADAEGS